MSYLEKLLDGAKVKLIPLGEVAELRRGTTITAKSKTDGNIHVISGGQKPAYYNGLHNRDGETITIAGSGAYAGFVMYWNEKIFVSDAFSVKPNLCILITKYIYHILLNNQAWIFNLKKGSGVPHVYPKDLATLSNPIPCPENPKKSLEIQSEIVRILDSFTELTARKKQYEYYRDSLLAFSKDIEWKSLGEVAKIQRGASPRPIAKYISEDNSGVAWIKIGDTTPNSKYVNKTEQKISQEGAEKSRLLKKGDFILSNSMSFGRPYILNIDGAIHDGWASISDFQVKLNPDFLYHFLASNFVQNYLVSKINSGSVSNLNSDIIKSLQIPVPPLAEQQRIVDILDKFDTSRTPLPKAYLKK